MILRTIPIDVFCSRLVDDGVFSKKEMHDMIYGKRKEEQEESVLISIENASKRGDKIMLLHYELAFLPQTIAKIHIITPAGTREFEYLE